MLQECAKAPANSNITIKPDTNTVAQIEIDTTMKTTKNHYILNTNSLKIHIPECSSVKNIAEYNKKDYYGEMSELLSDKYAACKQCDPE